MLTVKPSALHHLCSAVPVARCILGGSLVAFVSLSSACGDDEVDSPPLLGAAGPQTVIEALLPDAGADAGAAEEAEEPEEEAEEPSEEAEEPEEEASATPDAGADAG